MNRTICDHYQKVLQHLYINPLEKCNLKCKICYTRKTNPILKHGEILDFVYRYGKVQKLETITFCGGEVFTLPYFTGLVNKLTSSVILVSPAKGGAHPGSQLDSGRTSFARMTEKSGIFVQIITNGTVDRLSEFKNPNMVNLIVSLDGLPEYHDFNRGKGNFAKSINFLKKARNLGFHTEIFSIVTRQNYDRIDEFEKYLNVILGDLHRTPHQVCEEKPTPGVCCINRGSQCVKVTYHPRKPQSYLLHHPISNIKGETDGFDFLTDAQMREIMKKRKTFPPKELGCYQIALVSNGDVYGCCEGTVPIGKINNEIKDLFAKLKERLIWWGRVNDFGQAGMRIKCLGCSQLDFVCGLRHVIASDPPNGGERGDPLIQQARLDRKGIASSRIIMRSSQ